MKLETELSEPGPPQLCEATITIDGRELRCQRVPGHDITRWNHESLDISADDGRTVAVRWWEEPNS